MVQEKRFLVRGTPLIKFQSRERILEIQQGKLYMKSCAWYRQFEDADDPVGDSREALIPISNAQIIVPELGIAEQIKDTGLLTSHSNDFAFCMLGINSRSVGFSFSDTQIEKLKGFGDTALIVTNYGMFLNRIAQAAHESGYQIKAGFVRYYDEVIDSVNNLAMLVEDMRNVAFLKRMRYSYQQEFRFVIHNPGETQDYMTLDIGSVADISQILSASDALKAMIEMHIE